MTPDTILDHLRRSPRRGLALRLDAMNWLNKLDGYDWSGIYALRGDLLHLDAFHEAFGTRPGDPMWRDPQQRVVIW